MSAVNWEEYPEPWRTIGLDYRLQQEAVQLLERGLARVRRGYCWGSFHIQRSWLTRRPKFCMHGALFCDDDGNHSYGEAASRAERFLQPAFGGVSLIRFGTRRFLKRRVIRAYALAIKIAKADLRVQRLTSRATWCQPPEPAE